MIQKYSISYLQYILQYFGSRYVYLGTGDNQELVYATKKLSQYIIILISNESITIDCKTDIQNHLRQNILLFVSP